MLDLSQCPELESDPEVLGGVWCFRGTRMPLFAVLENIESGVENVLELFSSLNKEQVRPLHTGETENHIASQRSLRYDML